MFVKLRMTANPFTVTPHHTVPQAIKLMEQHRVRQLPVLSDGELVGVISHGDIAAASPSRATSLADREITYLMDKLKVGKVMSKHPVTVAPDSLLEEAAVLMRDRKIEMLPVLDGHRLVGVITESDLLDAFIELLGFRDHGTRLTVDAADVPGALSKLTAITARFGANISHLAVFRGATGRSEVVVGVNSQDTAEMEAAIKSEGFEVVHRLEIG